MTLSQIAKWMWLVEWYESHFEDVILFLVSYSLALFCAFVLSVDSDGYIPPSYISNAKTQWYMKSIFLVNISRWIVRVTFWRSHSVSDLVFSCPLVRIGLSIDSDTVTYSLVTLVTQILRVTLSQFSEWMWHVEWYESHFDDVILFLVSYSLALLCALFWV